MAYLSLYRKWRPQTFDEVVGQEHVVRTLKNALDSRRAAHAYIFAGPRGTGKTTLARLLAKGLNCEHGPTGSPCNRCANCVRVARGASVDVIEIDGASNRGIDEIRDIREMVKFAPAEGQYKVYIIDEVHMLTTEAFNALLKVLEEPPGHVVFVFATTEPHKIPATIVSRCQKFDFRAFTVDEIAAQLAKVAQEEGVSIEPEARALIALHSEGGMRDALGYLDQCIAFASGTIDEAAVAQVLGVVEAHRLEELADALAQGDLGRCLTLVKTAADEGRDLKQFTADAVRYFRDLLVLAAAPGSRELVAMTQDGRERAAAMAQRFTVDRLLEIVEALGRAEGEARWASSAQLPLEMALIQLVRGGDRSSLQDLVRRVEALERRLTQGAGSLDSRPSTGVARETPPPSQPSSVRPPWDLSTDTRSGSLSPGSSTARATPPASKRPALAATAEPREGRVGAPGPDARGMDAGSRPAQETTPSASSWETQRAGATPSIPRESAPSQASQVPGGDATPDEQSLLQAVQAAWPMILETLRTNKNVQQEAFLREGRPVAVQGETIIVSFSPNHRFHQANMEKERNRSIVEKAMSRVLGRNVRMQAVLGAVGESAPAAAGPIGPGPEPGLAGGGAPPVAATSGRPAATGAAAAHGGGSMERARPDHPADPPFADEAAAGVAVDPSEIDEPIVKAALKLFGGTITRIERKEPEQP